jgi:RND family efflux transporter MFP subunit
VTTEAVRRQDLRRVIDVVGTLAAADEVTIASEAVGKVVQIRADLGDRVKTGDVIVELDRAKAQYKVDQQRATLNRSLAKVGTQAGADIPPLDQVPDVRKASTQMAQSELAWKRAGELSQKSLISQEQLEDAEAKYVTDKAAYEAALQNAKDLRADIDASEAALRLSERELMDTTIRAPFDGYIQKRLVSLGQFVQVQTPIASLVKVDPLKLVAEVPERMAPWVKAGGKVSLTVDAYPDHQFEGTVSRLSPAINQQSRAFPLEADVPNHDGALKPGTYARARIESDRVDTILTVPYGAIQNRYGVNRLFVVEGDRLVSVEVKLGDRLGERVEITGGIEGGKPVVVSDVDRLAEDMRVQVRAK